MADAFEFFIDRSLGRHQVPQALRDAGLTVHTMAEVYGEWPASGYGTRCGWKTSGAAAGSCS